MIPGMPGGTQLAWGESCGGLAWNVLRMSWYAGVSEGCSGRTPGAPRRPPKLISQTPSISGNCAMDAQVPPGNLLASAARQRGAASATRPRLIAGRTRARLCSIRMCINGFPFNDPLYTIGHFRSISLASQPTGCENGTRNPLRNYIRNGPARDGLRG